MSVNWPRGACVRARARARVYVQPSLGNPRPPPVFILIRPVTHMHPPFTHTLCYVRDVARARAQRLSRRDDWFPSHYSRSLSLDIFSLPTLRRSFFSSYVHRVSLSTAGSFHCHLLLPTLNRPSLSTPDLFFPTQSPAR